MGTEPRRVACPAAAAIACLALGGCAGGFAVSLPPRAILGPAFLATESGAERALDRGHALMAAGDAEAALKSFREAAVQGGGTEAIAAMGTANLALRRLGQAEPLLRHAAEREPDWPAAWNNLGVVLLETGRAGEAAASFRRAYALGDGASEAVRRNLVLAERAAAKPPAPPPVTSATSTRAAAPEGPAAER